MGRETISSQELAEYTHINSTQIRRDLSGFGKFGKRGVGYRVESLVSEIRKILHTSGQHNIALFGAGNLGQAIASSDIFADHGFRIVAIFDADRELVGHQYGGVPVRAMDDLGQVVREDEVVVGVLAVPARRRAAGGRPTRRGRGEDHLQLLRTAPPGAARGHRPHLEPRRRPALRALLLPRLRTWPRARPSRHRASTSTRTREVFEASQDFTIGLEEEFAFVDPDSLELVHRFAELYGACLEDELLADSAAGELIDTEIEIRSGRAESFAEAVERQQLHRERLFAIAEGLGIALAATGTHPWANYLDQRIIDTEHYNRLREELRWVAQRNNTWSAHVHVGIRGADRAIAVCDHLRGMLPPLLALSANSPFLDGRDTGLASVRTEIFTRTFPRCGVPEPFGDWRAYVRSSSTCSPLPSRSSRRPSSGGACARITSSAPSSCGSATPRPAARNRSASRR